MNILIVIAIPCFMASFMQSAPLLGETSALVEDPEFRDLAQRSQSLLQKILLSIPETHTSCIHTETLQLNSAENSKFAVMATNIGIPSAPVLKVVSDSFTSTTSLRQMSEGLQQHRALLRTVLPQLDSKAKVTELLADIRDLLIQIHKMLRKVQAEPVVQPTAPGLALRLPGEYEVQVATHLTLVQLQSFGQDMVRSLRSIAGGNEEATES